MHQLAATPLHPYLLETSKFWFSPLTEKSELRKTWRWVRQLQTAWLSGMSQLNLCCKAATAARMHLHLDQPPRSKCNPRPRAEGATAPAPVKSLCHHLNFLPVSKKFQNSQKPAHNTPIQTLYLAIKETPKATIFAFQLPLKPETAISRVLCPSRFFSSITFNQMLFQWYTASFQRLGNVRSGEESEKGYGEFTWEAVPKIPHTHTLILVTKALELFPKAHLCHHTHRAPETISHRVLRAYYPTSFPSESLQPRAPPTAVCV